MRQILVMNPGHALKDMTERPMPQVMQQRRYQADRPPFLIDLVRPAQKIQNPPGRLHHAQTMAVSRMIRRRIGKRRHPQLANPPQALNIGGIQQPK